MKFRFPIVIIDEDYRSENTSGLGIRALAQAIESEGFEVLGVTRYGDLSQFAQQQSRASAFILSIDDEEFTPGPDLDPAVVLLRTFIEEVRRKNSDVPIYVLRRDQDLAPHPQRHPARAARLHPHVRGHAGVRGPPHHPRGQELPGGRAAAVLQGAARLRRGRLVLLALPGPLGRRRVPEEPGGPDVPPVLRREHAARRRVQRGGRTRPAAGPHRPGGRQRAQRRADLQRRPLLLRHQRHQHLQQDGLAPHGGAGRRGGGGPQLPQVDPARDHHDRGDPRVHEAHAQSLRHHRTRSRKASSSRPRSRPRSGPTRCSRAWMRTASSRG